jgi:hypothetical protein
MSRRNVAGFTIFKSSTITNIKHKRNDHIFGQFTNCGNNLFVKGLIGRVDKIQSIELRQEKDSND